MSSLIECPSWQGDCDNCAATPETTCNGNAKRIAKEVLIQLKKRESLPKKIIIDERIVELSKRIAEQVEGAMNPYRVSPSSKKD